MPPGRNIERPERAEFKALPPDLDIPHLIHSTPNFQHVTRMDARNINSSTMSDMEEYIHDHVIKKGLPLVIENWHLRSDWPSWIFNTTWLAQNHGSDRINVRDLKNQADIPMSFGHYLNNLGKLASKFHPNNFDGQGKHQRLYGKDLDCPPIWRQTLSDLLPQSTFYLAPLADLMSSLPESARAENMMCYVGHEGTYTPAHKEMCASLGQNIMVAASKAAESPSNCIGAAGSEGSSIWFMMGRDDREVIAEYWLAQLGHDIEVEKHFASVEDLANAPFTVYIVEQKVGDYILVPSLAPHQVWNRGEYTVKAAWNRTTVDTLQYAMNEALPKARLVCRDEQYKNRAIIYETLCKYLRVLKSDNDVHSPDHIKGLRSRNTLESDFMRLFNLFNTILLDQCFDVPGKEKDEKTQIEKIDNEYNVTCSFCRANIWNRFLSCERCAVQGEDGEEDYYDVCIDCYARGRSCGCQSGLKWVQQEDWESLLKMHEEFRTMVIEIQGSVSVESPKRFNEALAALQRKTVARVCHEQNKIRPLVDITKDYEELEDSNDDTKRKKKTGQLLPCHVCKVKHDRWKSAACTNPGCTKAYCYGNLWRAFDMDPCDDVLVKFNWKCPVCLGVCSCGACQKNPKMKPHHPRGTFLGADTKHYVDPRSVEILVDFRRGNLSWLKPGEIDPMTRLKRKRNEDDDDVSMTGQISRNRSFNVEEGEDGSEEPVSRIPIDPALPKSDEDTETSSSHGTPPITKTTDGNKDPDNSHQDGYDDSLSSRGKSGGGQYNQSPKSPFNHPLGTPLQTDPAIGMAGSRLQSGEGNDTRISSGLGDSSQQRVTLPSPSAMLTGALPPRRNSPGPPSYFSHDSTYFSQHSYPQNSSAADKSHSSISSSEEPSNSHTPNDLSVLEQNPIAFIAAAGLMQISNDHSNTPYTTTTPTTSATATATATASSYSGYSYENRPTLSEVGASGWGVGDTSDVGVDGMNGQSHVDSSSNSHFSMHTNHLQSSSSSNLQYTQSPIYPSLRYTPINAFPKPPPVPAPLPPSLLGNPGPNASTGKGKRKKSGNVASGLLPLDDKAAEHEAVKFSWVKQQQKLAKDRKRWKQARKKSKIVILRIPSEKLRDLEEQWNLKDASNRTVVPAETEEPEDDLVTTDLVPVKKASKMEQNIAVLESPMEDTSPERSVKRVAPGWVEISEDEDEDNIDEGSQIEDMDKDDEEYRGWGARQYPKHKYANAAPTKKSSRRVNKREFLGKEQSLQDSSTRGQDQGRNLQELEQHKKNRNESFNTERSFQDGEFVDSDVPYTVAAAQPRSESEARQLAEQEEANKKLEEEKRVEFEREQARKAEEERKYAEEVAIQKAKEEARRQAAEAERKRKEEIARAYRESKLLALKVATGQEPLDAWEEEEEEEEEEGGGEEEEGDGKELIPEGRTFAIIVDGNHELPTPDRDQYEVFDDDFNDAENAFSAQDDGLSMAIPDLDISMEISPQSISASAKTQRGRPKNTRVLAVPHTTASTILSARKKSRVRKSGDEDSAFRGSRPRPSRRRPSSKISDDNSDNDNGFDGDNDKVGPRRKKPKFITPKFRTNRRDSTVAKSQERHLKPKAVDDYESDRNDDTEGNQEQQNQIRSSSRKRKSKTNSYNFDSDDENIGGYSGYRRNNHQNYDNYYDDYNSLTEQNIGAELDIDPDMGVLEREKARSKSGTVFGARVGSEAGVGRGAGYVRRGAAGGRKSFDAGRQIEGDGEEKDDDDEIVQLEDEYNSRWRRKVV